MQTKRLVHKNPVYTGPTKKRNPKQTIPQQLSQPMLPSQFRFPALQQVDSAGLCRREAYSSTPCLSADCTSYCHLWKSCKSRTWKWLPTICAGEPPQSV